MADLFSKGIVYDIQRYSLHDGPGIRTIVFLKGCPLRCSWCCNPESQRSAVEVAYNQDLCIACDACVEACQSNAIHKYSEKSIFRINKSVCTDCLQCVDVCPTNAIYSIGQEMTIQEVLDVVMKDASYYRRSGGGVTLSGGEPLVWSELCKRLLSRLYARNINTAVETCGCAPWEAFERVIDFVDLFLFDIKCMDSNLHLQLTGASNEGIISNLYNLRAKGKEIVIRAPIIPGINDSIENIKGIADLMNDLRIDEINLMPYHNLGSVKYDRLCREYSLSEIEPIKFAPDIEERLSDMIHLFDSRGIRVMIGG